MIVDEAEILIRAGKGGDGCVSFRREKYVPRGGPDGGDGGNGGSVIAVAADDVDTLTDYSLRREWFARSGQPGRGEKCKGRDGEDLILRMPPGTLIFDRDTGILIKDLKNTGETVCLAHGGAGGKGNTRFASATNQAPRECEPGGEPEERRLRLELKLIADVGIVGLPNAGKSTLLSRLSRAHPKIADYPFTTLNPQLGIVQLSDERRLVLADIPGLIAGAHEGAGLGHDFLKHIERTRVLLHLVDIGSELSGIDPLDAYRTIRHELEEYSPSLGEKMEIVAANKVDLAHDLDGVRSLEQALGKRVYPISGATGEGLNELMELLWAEIRSSVDEPETSPVHTLPTPPHRM